jgi:hypothetical protein
MWEQVVGTWCVLIATVGLAVININWRYVAYLIVRGV